MEKIIIKISGESIKSETSKIVDVLKLQEIAQQIKIIDKKYGVGIVLGGGNIWRGAKDIGLDISRPISDGVGMIATVINAIALQAALAEVQINAKIFSPLQVGNFTHGMDFIAIEKWMNEKNQVCIFAGGTGNPYFTTDSGAALAASIIDAKWILMGKNGVDGVFDDDPKTNAKAKFFKKLSYQEIIEKRLKVMDLTALTICMENKIKLKVFDVNKPNSIIDAIENRNKLTVIE